MPVFEVEVLLDDSADDLVFVPAPEEFQVPPCTLQTNHWAPFIVVSCCLLRRGQCQTAYCTTLMPAHPRLH